MVILAYKLDGDRTKTAGERRSNKLGENRISRSDPDLELGGQNVLVQGEQIGGVDALDVRERRERVHLRFGVPNIDLEEREDAD